MKTAIDILVKSVTGAFGGLLLVAGVFVAIIGIVSGWGEPTVLRRIAFALLGALTVCLGYFLMYWASDRNLSTLLKRYFLGWLRLFLP
jgi:dolichyl-phosphate-mannose--protein O-mannosyl transferase